MIEIGKNSFILLMTIKGHKQVKKAWKVWDPSFFTQLLPGVLLVIYFHFKRPLYNWTSLKVTKPPEGNVIFKKCKNAWGRIWTTYLWVTRVKWSGRPLSHSDFLFQREESFSFYKSLYLSVFIIFVSFIHLALYQMVHCV